MGWSNIGACIISSLAQTILFWVGSYSIIGPNPILIIQASTVDMQLNGRACLKRFHKGSCSGLHVTACSVQT